MFKFIKSIIYLAIPTVLALAFFFPSLQSSLGSVVGEVTSGRILQDPGGSINRMQTHVSVGVDNIGSGATAYKRGKQGKRGKNGKGGKLGKDGK